MNILIIEDNKDIAANIADYLEPLGHVLDFAFSGTAGVTLAEKGLYDVIVLDVMLPGLDGLAVCSQLRERQRNSTPVLMLTARDQLEDKLAGFAAGVDDYLVKPFSLRELEARLLALVKRQGRQLYSDELVVADLRFDVNTLQASRQDRALDLNPVQRALLQLLMSNTHRVVTRRELEQQVWGDDPPDNDLLRSHIYSLRAIIDKPFKVRLLHTVHGTGYRLCEPEQGRQ